uniref:CCHC-type domain-containing protein n=1 Tax=Homalodisca liturata TaxID=320908 RepID=A0A1B6K2E2_9HEMI
MALKVDLLTKEELVYELMLRNVNTDKTDKVTDLRKRLRSVIKLNVQPNFLNLQNKLKIAEEFEIIKVKVSSIESSVEEILISKSTIDIVRFEQKLNHLQIRIKNLLKFKLDSTKEEELHKYMEKLGLAETKFKTLEVDSKLKEDIVRRLSETNMEEEDLSDVFENKLTFSASKSSDKTPIAGLTYRKEGECGNDEVTNTSIFSKLPNPVEKHLKNFKITNGLNISELLEFIKNLLKLKNETHLLDTEVIELCLGYVTGPLLSKIMECKSDKKDIQELHSELLHYFVPLGLKENLKRELVTRQQKPGEPLSVYITEVRENSNILNCNYSEEELVEIIKLGINQDDRARLVFMKNPKTFEDLDRTLLCIQAQNVAYADHQRRKVNVKNFNVKPKFVSNIQEVKKCFNCNRVGHIAKNCYRPRNNLRNYEQKT